MNNSPEAKLAVLESELRRVNERLSQLEKQNDATTAIINKYGGGLAVAILIISAVWAIVVSFGASLQKVVGH